jgi:hypothetical protein
MKKLLIFSISILILLVIVSPAKACEPCFKILTLEETAEQADLIIIGKKVKEGPSTGQYPQGGPDWIEIKVLETLKGEAPANRIKVNSWDGMCNYGIIITDKREYLIFLAEREDFYKAVDIGCAAKQFPIENGIVEMYEESVPLDEFVTRLGLERGERAEDGGVLPFCGSLGMGVMLLGMVIVAKRKD